MADYHVLNTDKRGKTQVVYHLAVPNAVLVGGSNVRTLIGADFSTDGSIVDNLATAETDQLTGGELYEHSAMMDFAGMSTVEVASACGAYFTAAPISVLQYENDKYKFRGMK